jgi:hypothetical protein
MEWYVLNYDFNGKRIEQFNIFRSVRFCEGVKKLLDEFITMDDFIEKLTSQVKYCFWCKREYEISAGDLYEHDLNKYERVDVSDQVLPNIKALAEYIVNYHNNQLN